MPSPSRLPTELILPPPNRWDAATLSVLGALLAFGPAAFGGADAWSELILGGLGAALAVLLLVRCFFDREFSTRFSWAFLPALAWLLLAAWQLLPLPSSLTAALAPAAAAARGELLGPDRLDGNFRALSAYPWGTAHALRLALLAATVLAAVYSSARSPHHIRQLLLIPFVIGGLEALLALGQIFTASKQYYWSLDGGARTLTSGSFVNYSNFSQFMNLSLGCGVALLLVSLHIRPGRTRHANVMDDRLFLGEELTWMIALLVLCAVSVFTSLSRNGAISLVVAAVAVGAALFAEGTLSRRGWILAAVPLIAVLGLLAFGFDKVYGRFTTLNDAPALADRWELTASTIRSWKVSPLWGTGLGTHELVYPRFDRSSVAVLAQHADNDYAQLLEESGLVGAAIAVTFFGLIARAAYRAMRRGRTPVSFAAFGLTLGLLAVGIHSATDFGLRMPANGCLLALVCGLILAIERWEDDVLGHDSGEEAAAHASSRGRRLALVTIPAIALIAAWTWALHGAWAAYLGERWWAAEQTVGERLRTSAANVFDEDAEQAHVDLIASAEQAALADPDNVKYQYGLNLDRWLGLSRASGGYQGLPQFDDAGRAVVAQIADQLKMVRNLAPTFGPAYSLEGQLRRFVLNDAAAETLIRRGMELAPYDSSTTFVAGQLAAQQGDAKNAGRLLARAVQLDDTLFRAAALICLDVLHRNDLAKTLTLGQYGKLNDLANMVRNDESQSAFFAELQAAAEDFLRRRVADDVARPDELATLARLHLQRGQADEAAALLHQAVVADYGNVDWHLQLAEALAAQGKFEDAMKEAKTCLHLRPHHEGAIKMIETLSARSTVPATEP